jgi:hypothetical protein
MNPTTTARSRRASGRLPAALLLAALAAASATPAPAQVTKPWVPQGDALLRDVTTARMRFQHQQGDSIGGDNYLPFDDVGRLARQLLQSLGREHVLQAPAIEATLDSLGLDTEVTIDPATPGIVFVLVRNPFRVSSDAVGFLLWYVRDDLRMQGASFPPAREARMRTWFTGQQESPYEAVVTYVGKGTPFRPGMKLFRMNSDGRYWNMIQYEGQGPEFGAKSTLSFVDVNHDGRPEILAYHPVDDDSAFVLRSGVPPVVNEFLYTERPEGFVLHDARTVPGPSETLRLFAALMAGKAYGRAKLLLASPGKISEAIANGWSQLRGKDAWIVEYGEPGQPWPEWLEVRTRSAGGPKRWIFHFIIQDTRWVIRDWVPVREKLPPGVSIPSAGARADSSASRRP